MKRSWLGLMLLLGATLTLGASCADVGMNVDSAKTAAESPKDSAVPSAAPGAPLASGAEIPEAPVVAAAGGQDDELPSQPTTKMNERPTNPSRQFQLRDLKTAKIKIGERTVPVWVMDTDAKRQEGMMFLRDHEVRDDEGFLFIFPDVAPRGFWMKNTILPLDLAFLARDGKILNIAQGKPFDESPIYSEGAAKFVLEMEKGSMAKYGIKAGMRAEIPKELDTKE